jgi:hypothetical protein
MDGKPSGTSSCPTSEFDLNFHDQGIPGFVTDQKSLYSIINAEELYYHD